MQIPKPARRKKRNRIGIFYHLSHIGNRPVIIPAVEFIVGSHKSIHELVPVETDQIRFNTHQEIYILEFSFLYISIDAFHDDIIAQRQKLFKQKDTYVPIIKITVRFAVPARNIRMRSRTLIEDIKSLRMRMSVSVILTRADHGNRR